MINILLKFVMFVINTFATILLSPFLAILNLAFPNLTPTLFTTLLNVFDYGFNLFMFFLDLFMVPSSIVILYLSLVATILVFNLAIRGYAFAIGLYHYFKP